MSILRASSTSSSTPWKYDVFISFRGEDTRNSFTDHLYNALKQKGINTFKDDDKLGKGKSIAPELSKAIEESRILLIVFSKNYASSTWCLDELVQIAQRINKNGETVFPIFYDVDPSTVRKQTGSFQEAFIKYDTDCIEKVQKWRNALEDVAGLSGFHLQNRPERSFIEDIIEEICKQISISVTHENLIGMSSRVRKVNRLLNGTSKSNNDHIVGIYGIGGIGKTTIARVVYDSVSHEFEGSSFLSNVGEISRKNGLVTFQKQLLCETLKEKDINIWNVFDGANMIKSRLRYKRVLVVIDDVDDIEQLNYLVGKPDWFGSNSRIIITTRDKHVLMTHGVHNAYEVEELDDVEAFQLFSLKAFKKTQPLEEYMELSEHFVKYASGLPLALQVLGSFLFGKTTDEWEDALERLHADSESKILHCLQISFDGLEEKDKKIFLDIACFFKGKNKDYVIRILDGCGLNPNVGIRVLVDRCLLNISNDNILSMHDLLQEMGQQIVKRVSLEDPGKRSRLWKKTDIIHMLIKNTGTSAVEGIILENEEELREENSSVNISAKAFLEMTNLRLLKIRGFQLFEGLEYLSNELRLLDWYGYSSKSLPSSLLLDKIVMLEIQCSCIEQLWKETRPLKKLKVINLNYSKMFKKTPDFTEVPNLEELYLEGCTRLCEIHPSLLVHKRLKLLNMKDCTSLTTLPSKIAMESLKKLVLSGCLKLKKFPEIMRDMECLIELFLDRTAIKELPLSIEFLTGLIMLSLEECKNLVRLPSNINGLKSLKTLNLSCCPNIENLPENLGQIQSLEELDIRGTATREQESNSWYSCFPFSSLSSLRSKRSSSPLTLKLPSLSGLISLKELNLSYRNIGVIPSDIGNLASLERLDLQGNNFVSLPASINRLSKLSYVLLQDCKRLQSIPELPSSLGYLEIDSCSSLTTLPNPLKLFQQVDVYCVNSMKLSDYSYAILMPNLRDAPIGERPSLCVPGSEIPPWISYQSKGSSVRVKSCPKLKLKGFVWCAIVSASKLQRGLRKRRVVYASWGGEALTGIYYDDHTGQGWPDHLFLMYVSIGSYNKSNHWHDIKIETGGDPGLEVKRCGAHPIYEEDMNQRRSSASGNLIEFHKDFVDGVESSGICNSEDEEEPQPKRQKKNS